MKKVFVFLFSLAIVYNANAQKLNPVKWTFEAEKKEINNMISLFPPA